MKHTFTLPPQQCNEAGNIVTGCVGWRRLRASIL
jgi:hypothetical protein